MSPFRLREAARRLRRGAVLAYPTEAVYGLGCDPSNAAAVYRLLAIKGRSPAKGLILIAAEFGQFGPYVQALDEGHRMAEILASWPGPNTWLLPATKACPSWLTGRHTTLAVRVTAHPIAAALCRAAGTPIVSTSANRSGRPPARTALQVRLRCGGAPDLVLHGSTGGLSRPTTIRDAATGAVIRGD